MPVEPRSDRLGSGGVGLNSPYLHCGKGRRKRIGDVLYFSPRYRFHDLDFHEAKAIIEAFQDRVEGFYLLPASRLIEKRHASAGGLVLRGSRVHR
jgi:hypothetical protein